MDAILNRLPRRLNALIGDMPNLDALEEIRVRIGHPVELRIGGERRILNEAIDKGEMRALIGALTEHSLYAREEEMKQGYFTIKGGFRVGLTGRYAVSDGEVSAITHVGSICIRVARQIIGAADGVMTELIEAGRPLSALILSPPGMGKTTMLRDIARQMASRGLRVAVSDERGELAGSIGGVPTMDFGPGLDVADGLYKHMAIPRLLRSMSPDVIVTDELGHAKDAEAVRDAARCGVRVIASAHGVDLEDVRHRAALGELVEEKLFARVIVLGGRPGNVVRVVRRA